MEKEKVYTEEVNQVNDEAIFDEEDFATFEEDLDEMLELYAREKLFELLLIEHGQMMAVRRILESGGYSAEHFIRVVLGIPEKEKEHE